jgi:hypothetical protein
MRDLRALGDVEVQTVRGQDAPPRCTTCRRAADRARAVECSGLRPSAVSIEQTIRVQNALDETQLRIENIKGQIKLLKDRTSFATIRALLREEGVKPKTEVVVENPSLPTAWDRASPASSGIAGVVSARLPARCHRRGGVVRGAVGGAAAWSHPRRPSAPGG